MKKKEVILEFLISALNKDIITTSDAGRLRMLLDSLEEEN